MHAQQARRRALAAATLAGACLTATLGLPDDSATAASSARVEARVQAGTLEITGTESADDITLRLAPGAATTLQVDVGGDGTSDFSFDSSTFTAIEVQARRGADTVTSSNGLGGLGELTIDGGAGDDTLSGSEGADVLIGGPGDDTVSGRGGNDVALLGAGEDRFTWNPGDGSDTVEGQGGNDVLGFNGSNASEHVAVSANGSRVRLLRDIAVIAMDLSGLEHVEVNALAGNDVITVDDLTGTDLKTAAIDLAATGGGGDDQADTVIANGTPGPDRVDVGSPRTGAVLVSGLSAQVQVSGSEAANDHEKVATQGGDDTVVSHVGIAGPAVIDVDGGLGDDTTTYDGTSSADAISISPNGSAVRVSAPATTPVDSSAVESLVVRGLGGADTVTSSNGLGALGQLRINGGAGDDTLSGSEGDDVLIGGPGGDAVSGRGGNDLALLGAGEDRFTWNPGDGSDTVEGQGAQDVLAFNGSNASERVAVSAHGSRVQVLRDIAVVAMDLNGLERVELNARAGNDVIAVDDLTGTALKTAAIDLTATATGGGGDAQADIVTVNGTPAPDRVAVTRDGAQVLTSGLAAQTRIVSSEPANDTLRVTTLGGDDRVTVAPDVSALIQAVVDLGADE